MKGYNVPYSEQELAFIKQNKLLTRKTIAELFNKKFNRTISPSNIQRLCQRKNWLNGNSGQFKKGHAFNPKSGCKIANRTSFKKGDKPQNAREIGAERINKDGYIEIKMHDGINSFYLKQRIVWMQHNGPIPKDHVIKFLDNNPMNCSIENLVLLNRRENAILRALKYSEMTEDLRESTLLTARLKAKVIELNA